MYKICIDTLKIETNENTHFHNKVLLFLSVGSTLLMAGFVILHFFGVVSIPGDFLYIDFPIRFGGLVLTVFFILKHKLSIAKYVFIIIPIILSLRVMIVLPELQLLPLLLMLFVFFPVYFSFFMNPKSGVIASIFFSLSILFFYGYLRIRNPSLFQETLAVSFSPIFLSPIILMILLTVISYYFINKNKDYIQVIEKSSDHVRSILNAVTEILLVINPRGYIQSINKFGLKILGYERDEILNKSLDIIFKHPENSRELLDKVTHNIFYTNYKVFLRTKKGKEIIAGLNTSIMYQKDTETISEVIITARDLTRLFRYTKRLKKINKKARTYQAAMLNMLEDLNEKNRILLETEHQVKEYSRLLEENIEQAKEHQAKLISVKTPLIHDIRFSSAYIPCEKVGGDIINIIVFHDIIFFYIADIVGHGVPAAILSSFIKASLDNWIKEEQHISPGFLLKKLNDVLVDEEIFKEKFFTIFIGKIILSSRELQYISAGHLSPIILDLENNEIEEITTRSRPVISMFELENKFHTTLKLPRRLRLLVYTDGLIEWEVQEGEFFGKTKLFRFFQKEQLSKRNLSDMVERAVSHQLDDISFILIELNDMYERRLFCSARALDSVMCEFEDEMSDRYPGDVVHKITRCFSELIMNAVVHGNKNNDDYETYIKARFCKDTVHLCVRDSGEGFNWRDMDLSPDGAESKNKPKGLVFVSAYSQSLEFNDRGNEVRCIFTVI